MEPTLSSPQKGSATEIQLCSFRIGQGIYAIPVLDVQEAVRPQNITKVPLAPDYIDGLMNLRGQVVTAINLRKLFQLESEAPTDYINIIIKNEDTLYAIRVDEILDVMTVSNSLRKDIPDTLDPALSKYVDCVYMMEKKLMILLNSKKLLNFNLNKGENYV